MRVRRIEDRKHHNISIGENLFGWPIDFTINYAFKIDEVCIDSKTSFFLIKFL